MASKGDVGFIGLGRMGGPMARNLAGAGYAVHVFDVDAAAVQRLGPSGAIAHDSPRAVASRVPILFTALPNNAIVTATYLGPTGILAGAARGTITCDCSTVSPEVSQRICAEAKATGVTHLDTPMLGSSPQAESGEVFFMVGGDPEAMPRVQPLLDVIGRLTMHVGPSGMGNRIKLLHNALGAVTAVAVAESLALCAGLGVDPRTYHEVVCRGGGQAYSRYFDGRGQRIIEGNYAPTFTVELMQKDVALAAEMAGPRLAQLPLLREALAAYTEALRAGWAGEDFSGVTHVVEDRLGLRIAP
jgi:3-hydroxyisobutyrate dehydrogenase-like beta-hydroxyacid dehydrogenase